METKQLRQAAGQYRRAAIIGCSVGLLGLASWVGYDVAMTPAEPAVPTATAAEVVAYISSERGLARLPEIEQREFFDRWQTHITEEAHKAELMACFEGLEDASRKQFAESISKHLKRVFMEDAERFARLATNEEKSRFAREKVEELRSRALFIKDVGQAFRSDLGGPDEFRQWLLEHTTARERAVGEPYAEALKHVGEQMKKEQRSANASG